MPLNIILHVLGGTVDGITGQDCVSVKPAAAILVAGTMLSGDLLFFVVAVK
jgi:hypothetical protein